VKFSTLFIVIPVVAAAGIIAVANRDEVVFSLDPFSPDAPSVSFAMPLYLLVFVVFFLGVVLGGLTALARRPKTSRGGQGRTVVLRE
jgi:hypothetical protein